MNPAKKLHEAGQNVWLESINRRLLEGGAPARYRDDLAVTGLTSNPTILDHAMAASSIPGRSTRGSPNEGQKPDVRWL